MTLAAVIRARLALVRAFRSSVEREQEVWRDLKFAAIREKHLAPLLVENERFDRELEAIAASMKAATRRLQDSR